MATLNYIVSSLRKTLKNQAPLLVRPFGLNLLSKAQTEAHLQPSLIAASQGSAITLPSTYDFADETSLVFSETHVSTAQTHVWSCRNTDRKMSQLRNGSISDGNKVLDTDFGTSTLFSDLFVSQKRAVAEAKTLLAPWSHYWGGYYDYLLFVAAKLCRMKDALPESVFQNAMVVYPLVNTTFERELLGQIGVRSENILDSRITSIQFDTCVMGDNDPGWFYPSETDVQALRKHITAGMPWHTGTPRRIYISRAGRRRVLNEAALIRVLERYDFTIIEDNPRTIAEQVALYRNASFIIGPHGASFANVLWCQPGTHLLELFAPNYAPDYFRYLAHLLGLRYSAHCYGAIGTYDHSYVNADITVSIDQLDRQLSQIFDVHHPQQVP